MPLCFNSKLMTVTQCTLTPGILGGNRICTQGKWRSVSTADLQSHSKSHCPSAPRLQLLSPHHFPLVSKASMQFVMSQCEGAATRRWQQILPASGCQLAFPVWFLQDLLAPAGSCTNCLVRGRKHVGRCAGKLSLPPEFWRPHQALGFFTALHSCCSHNFT